MNIYKPLVAHASENRKKFAVLLDPDKCEPDFIKEVIRLSVRSEVDYFFIGGSLLVNDNQASLIAQLKEKTKIPVMLFPGNNLQLNNQADGILLLSLISGRNPDMLIGRHVISAPFLKASNLEILSTGYMLIESGGTTTVMYMSNTTPIPAHKNDIAVCTAMAGEMLGMKLIYMDAGSGAKNPITKSMISAVRNSIQVPLIVGGGITSPELAKDAFNAGADVVVVGNAIEQNPSLIGALASSR